MSKFVVDFKKRQDLFCCNRKIFDDFQEFYSFVTFWLKRTNEIERYKIIVVRSGEEIPDILEENL